MDLLLCGNVFLAYFEVTYVGGIRSIFHALQLRPIRFTQWSLCCNYNFTMKHQPKSN